MKYGLSSMLIVCLITSGQPLAAQGSRPAINAYPITAASDVRGERKGEIAKGVTWVADVKTGLVALSRNGSTVSVELRSGARLTGVVERLRRKEFELISQSVRRDTINYNDVAAFIDPASGQLIAAVQQPTIGGVGRPTLETTLIVLGVLTAALLIYWLTVPK